MIYFMQVAGSEPVKIGCSKDPLARAKAAQLFHWRQVYIIGTMPGARSDERVLHVLLADSRIRGEWFSLTPEVQAVIDACPHPMALGPECPVDIGEDPPDPMFGPFQEWPPEEIEKPDVRLRVRLKPHLVGMTLEERRRYLFGPDKPDAF